jgi:hypothetical protein
MRHLTILLLIIILSSTSYAQYKFAEFQVGLLMPADAKNGFIGGLSFGRMVDESVGWAIEVNYYHRSYIQETKVPQTPQGQVEPFLVTTEIDNSTTLLPLYLKLVLNTQIAPSLDLRLMGGAGYEFMWNNETNYKEKIDDTRFYSGFTWLVGAGLSMPVSRASDLYAEINYHSGSPSKDEGETVDGLPVRTEVDMTGFMVRAGIRLYNFGF